MSPAKRGHFGMILYGINIAINKNELRTDLSVQDGIVAEVVKKRDEREIFMKFLDFQTSSGTSVFENLQLDSQKMAQADLDNGVKVDAQLIEDYIERKLKATQHQGTNLYTSLIQKVICELAPNMNGMDPLKNTAYPGLHKRATSLLTGKIKDSIDQKTILEYLIDKRINETIKGLGREMFYGINKLGLNGEYLIKYLYFIFSVDKISQLPIRRGEKFKRIVGESLKNDTQINFVLIKCLRYCYPDGQTIHLVPHMDDAVVNRKDGKPHSLKSERLYFQRLSRFQNICKESGIDCQINILIDDLGIDDLFPLETSELVTSESLLHAKTNGVQTYFKVVCQNASPETSVTLLSNFLNQKNALKNFRVIAENVVRELRRGSNFIAENILEPQVDYRFESNNAIFVCPSSRKIAREMVERTIGSLFALEVLDDNNSILITEDRGAENLFMGGKDTKNGIPIAFIKLRDDQSFDVK